MSVGSDRRALGASLLASISECADQWRSNLLRQYGWTHLDIHATIDASARTLTLTGQAITPRAAEVFRQRTEQLIPAGWTVRSHVRVPGPIEWRRLRDSLTPLWREFPHSPQPPTLATELLRNDGPVGVIARVDGASLVRGRDGTLGWTVAPLGPPTIADTLPVIRRSALRLGDVLRSFLGTPYASGGTTRQHVDCSGLVQRAYREALGVILPRHSTDQLAWPAPPGRPPGVTGDLVFIWQSGESTPHANCHVGVLLAENGTADARVIHASTSRQRVVEDPLGDFLRAGKVAHVTIESITSRWTDVRNSGVVTRHDTRDDPASKRERMRWSMTSAATR